MKPKTTSSPFDFTMVVRSSPGSRRCNQSTNERLADGLSPQRNNTASGGTAVPPALPFDETKADSSLAVGELIRFFTVIFTQSHISNYGAQWTAFVRMASGPPCQPEMLQRPPTIAPQIRRLSQQSLSRLCQGLFCRFYCGIHSQSRTSSPLASVLPDTLIFAPTTCRPAVRLNSRS